MRWGVDLFMYVDCFFWIGGKRITPCVDIMIEWLVVIMAWQSVTLGSKTGKLNIFLQIRPRLVFQYHPQSNINLISLPLSVCPQIWLDLKMCVSKWMEPLKMILWTATGQGHNSPDPEHPNTVQLDAEPLSTSSTRSRSNYRPFTFLLCRFQPKQPIRGNTTLSLLLLFMKRFMAKEMAWIHFHSSFSTISVYESAFVCI